MDNKKSYEKQAQLKKTREENWMDDVLERQQRDLEEEEEILNTIPNRIRQKWLGEEE